MDPTLELEPEITISRLHGEDIDACVALLDHIVSVMKSRARWLADQPFVKGQYGWTGERSVVVIVPCSEVLEDHRAVSLVQVLARTGRATGIDLRLIDAHPPLREGDEVHPPLYSLAVFGSAVIQAMAGDPDVKNVTFHQVSPYEMVELTENN